MDLVRVVNSAGAYQAMRWAHAERGEPPDTCRHGETSIETLSFAISGCEFSHPVKLGSIGLFEEFGKLVPARSPGLAASAPFGCHGLGVSPIDADGGCAPTRLPSHADAPCGCVRPTGEPRWVRGVACRGVEGGACERTSPLPPPSPPRLWPSWRCFCAASYRYYLSVVIGRRGQWRPWGQPLPSAGAAAELGVGCGGYARRGRGLLRRIDCSLAGRGCRLQRRRR